MRLIIAALVLFASMACAEAGQKNTEPHQAVTEIGALSGVGYRIDVPEHWNRGLLVFYHGYAVTPVTFHEGERISPMFDGMLKRGFAVIQSAYSQTGWAVEQGFADTERLRTYFVGKYGRPKETLVAGMSMGGALTAMTIEKKPEVYDAALSLCGAIEPSDRLLQRDFALRAAFDYYFPGVMGPLAPVPDDYMPTDDVVRKIAAAMNANPAATRSLLAIYGAADAETLPDIIAFITYDTKEMQRRAHGNPFGNEDLVYTGSGDDFALNDGVRRYHGDAKAIAYMARWYTPSGKLLRPMLALHDSGDPLVPASSAFEYALIAQRAGHGDNFVQQYVNAKGHCVFTPAQIDTAFGELIDWKRDDKRPAAGKLP